MADSAAADIRIGWATLGTVTTNRLGLTTIPALGNFTPGIQIMLEDPAELPLVQDPAVGWQYGGYASSLFQIALHEIGHALGLAHDADTGSVMYPSAGLSNADLDNTDIAGIDALYGLSPANPGQFSIASAVVVEGDSGTTPLSFTVTRSGGSAATSVRFATLDGTATAADGDYLPASGALVFAAGVTSRTITVSVLGDIRAEPDESFSVQLSGPTNGASIATATATGMILNDDLSPGTGVGTIVDSASSLAASLTSPTASLTSTTVMATTNVETANASAATSGTIPVYRFFDRSFGTHFFTASIAERNALVSTRTDLAYEGVGLQSLNPAAADPLIAPVFRFFDTAHGTHFFTASAAESATIVATRTDLRPEGIGFYEHIAPAAGDQPVYRFFDTALGTHFYTADASERATILATRTDLKDEGIGFYAPSGP